MNAPRMANQVLDNVAEIAEKAKDLSAKVKERLDDTYHDLDRTVRRAKAATEDRLDDVRQQVKNRPLTSVAAVAAGAFAVGILTGWLLGRKTRS
ncbi:MAG: hypothetical protein LAO76_14645 [Acidobacteriia bacterium]|jgi:ElaB/YqjD/DUF883 family membrane-anchored ribosome-binding protein|nr:hypothetical protein [Terriglobia bacterium]HLK07916.1 hypothetical protein [Candidatus Angelobacter sp.]